MQYLLATKYIPNSDLSFNFETYNDIPAVWGPVNVGDLCLGLGFVFGLKLNMFGVWLYGRVWQHNILLHEYEIILKVSEVLFAEMHELVHVVIRSPVVIVVKAETSQDFFSQEIHYQNICILATYCYEST